MKTTIAKMMINVHRHPGMSPRVTPPT
jgi:hypothetical protein